MPTSPTVTVSSTFFDLEQIRADLAAFLDDIGYRPLLSELPSFPIDPNADTIENCRLRAYEATLFVLVVGGRYGSIDPRTGISVTNMEYAAARALGTPTYVFVQRRILDALPVWEQNRDGDFSKVVDSTRLFEFVQSIRGNERIWVTPFDTAADITRALRIQFAYLFNDALTIHQRARRDSSLALSILTGRALRLALEQSDGWEYRLFFQTWIDEISSRRDAILAYNALLKLGPAQHVTFEAYAA